MKSVRATHRLRTALAWLALFCASLLLGLPAFAQDALAPIPPLTGPVVDTTGTLDAATVQSLTQQSLALRKSKGSQLQVLVIPTTQPEDIAQYSVRAFESYKLGRGELDDGLLLVVAKDDRRVHIEVGYGLEGPIPDATANRVIQEYLVPKFRAGDFSGGIVDATATLRKLVEGEALPAPMAAPRSDGNGDIFQALVFAFFAAIFINVFFRWAPKLLRFPASLAVPGFLALTTSQILGIGLLGGFIGFIVFLLTLGGGQFARSRSWGSYPSAGTWGSGGGSWGGGGFGGGGGGFGGGGGGGWSGGGGSSGGGGASGSW